MRGYVGEMKSEGGEGGRARGGEEGGGMMGNVIVTRDEV